MDFPNSRSRRVESWNDRGQPFPLDPEFQRVLEDLERANEELAADLDKPLKDAYDVVVIGSGPGGGTMAYALRAAGKSVLLVERGDFLPTEPENWDTDVVLHEQRYSNSGKWLNAEGKPFDPLHYYYVGGQTKLYAGTLLRFREEDFEETEHEDGISPAWPISYDDIEPFYAEAERIYLAHGQAGEDATEPWRSGPFPYPPVPVVPEVAHLRDSLEDVGLNTFAMPQGLALSSGGRCIFCSYCDSYPCRVLARGEPELCCVRPALRSDDVTLLTRATATRLVTDGCGREVTAVEIERDGETLQIKAGVVVLAAGAVNTPALLFQSATDAHPDGLANSSGLVGANYRRHDITVLMARNPSKTPLPQDHFWKSFGLNDYYHEGPDWPYPLGTVQVIGNYKSFMPNFMPDDMGGSHEERLELASQMQPIFLLTEDLPSTDNRVGLTDDGRIQLSYDANNLASHNRLVDVMTAKLHEAGYDEVTAQPLLEIEQGGGYHHCGTTPMGTDPAESVLDARGKAHDLDNLYIVGASSFSSASACNPVLTIAANSLRVAEHVKQRL